MSQFGLLDQLQKQLLAANPSTRIRLVGVNGDGYGSANDLAVAGNDIPWLQDTQLDDAYGLWQVAYRDVVILDEDGVRVGVFSLLSADLRNAATYEALRTLLLEKAGE